MPGSKPGGPGPASPAQGARVLARKGRVQQLQGMVLVKYWSNTGQILVKYISNTGQIQIKFCILVKHAKQKARTRAAAATGAVMGKYGSITPGLAKAQERSKCRSQRRKQRAVAGRRPRCASDGVTVMPVGRRPGPGPNDGRNAAGPGRRAPGLNHEAPLRYRRWSRRP